MTAVRRSVLAPAPAAAAVARAMLRSGQELSPMTLDNGIGIALALALAVYLVYALVRPERF
jgi:K+-transporting ATPase KdpF subunit